MKLAVACESLTTVACHLGRAPLFLIYDDASGKPELVDQRVNPSAGHPDDCHDSGAGTHAAGHHRSIVDAVAGCGLLVARGMGRRIADDLAANGIRPVLITDDVAPYEAAKLALADRGGRAAGFCSCHESGRTNG